MWGGAGGNTIQLRGAIASQWDSILLVVVPLLYYFAGSGMSGTGGGVEQVQTEGDEKGGRKEICRIMNDS